MGANLLPERIGDLRVEVSGDAERVDALSANLDQPVRIGDRQASEADGIGQLEERGVRADAEGQRHDAHGGKYRRAAQCAQAVPCVAREAFHERTRHNAIVDESSARFYPSMVSSPGANLA